MRFRSPFQPDDLAELDQRLLSQADAVVAMETIAEGASEGVIGLRHDCDNVIIPAVQLAEWEAERGYRSTYFILHTAPYWQEKRLLEESLDRIAELGHEIGFHVNALTVAIELQADPVWILEEALDELRSYGHPVHGVVAHGDNACYEHGFVNDEVFTESPRPTYGEPDRVVGGILLEPVSRTIFGLDYDPNWLPRGDYLSDSGGRWSRPFDQAANSYPTLDGQLHILCHPCWWSEALVPAEVAA